MIKAALALVILLASFTTANAAESMKTAINIVEDFSREANILMTSRALAPLDAAVKEAVVEELGRIRLTEPPGKKRSEKVYGLVSSYTGNIADLVRESGGQSEDLADIAGRLDAMRDVMLKKLRAAQASESVEKKMPRPVPSLDLSPHDEPPSAPGDGLGGILYR